MHELFIEDSFLAFEALHFLLLLLTLFSTNSDRSQEFFFEVSFECFGNFFKIVDVKRLWFTL